MTDREKIISAIEKAKKESAENALDRIIVPFKEANMIIDLLKEQEDLGKELTNAVELIHKKNEQIKKLLKLLKDEEAVKPNRLPNKKVVSYKNVVYQYSCGNCSTLLRNLWKACPLCRKPVKWNDD